MTLAATQLLSLVTKAITTALGIIQSIIVIRLLGPTGWGLVGLVMSIGGLIGVTQHLGVVDGAIREIAIRHRKDDIGKVFWVSNLVRQLVTIPLSVILVVLAGTVATRLYGRPEITLLIQLFAASLILQGVQDVFGATLTGMKKFGLLYVVQIITAALNIVVFGYLTWAYGIAGFFWAVIITTAIMILFLAGILVRELRGYLQWPSRSDIRYYARSVMRIGAFMYVARIFFVMWQRLPLLVLGGVLATDELGYFNVALTFGSKLTIIAMALSEVNLVLMSSLFTDHLAEFGRIVVRNMRRVFVLMLGISFVLLFFVPEIIHYAIGPEFLPAQRIVLLVTVAFFFYSLLDLGSSSIFVAANKPHVRAGIYAIMTSVTGAIVVALLLWRPDPLLAAVAVMSGALLGYIMMLYLSKRYLQLSLITRPLVVLLAALALSVVWLFSEPAVVWRIIVFLLLFSGMLFEVKRSNLLPRLRAPGYTLAAQHNIVCFAGAFYDAPTWTNRQHVMSRLAQHHTVLYVEPRVWIVRYLLDHWRQPYSILRFLQRIVLWETPNAKLFIKAQWNLIPGSREYRWIGRLNHGLNGWNVRLAARLLGLHPPGVIWLYDTEAAEYLDEFRGAKIVYDCVDDHAVQAGPDRNASRVRDEERLILQRAHLVTVTSQHLFEQKKPLNPNTHLVEQGADVVAFALTPHNLPFVANHGKPIIGSVGALDSYKYDFSLIAEVAAAHPEWYFVFVGEPTVNEQRVRKDYENPSSLRDIAERPNVELVGSMPRTDVPRWVHRFDVCIIPYRANVYNRSSFPLKFWEFMATGKPIVVSGLPELQRYEQLIHYAATAHELAQGIAAALTTPTVGRVERMALATEHSWDKRVQRLLTLLYSIP